MLIFGLVGVFLCLLIVIVISLSRKDKEGYYEDKDGLQFGLIFMAMFLLITLIAVLCIYASNVVRVAELKAFSEVNVQNYATTVTETRAILSGEEFTNKIVAGSLEKTDVGQGVSQRITEWRDAVNRYNLEVANKQKSRTIWLYPGFLVMPKEVEELKLLTIK